MSNYGIIQNNKIINVIVAESNVIDSLLKENQESILLETGTPWINWERIGTEWFNPNPPVEESTND
jgi:hypothetical protein